MFKIKYFTRNTPLARFLIWLSETKYILASAFALCLSIIGLIIQLRQGRYNMILLKGTPAEIAEYMDRQEKKETVNFQVTSILVPQESHVDTLLKEVEFYRKTKVRAGGQP